MPRGGKRDNPGGRPSKPESEKRVQLVLSTSPQLAAAIDARWRELGHKDRSAYLKALVEADLKPVE